MLWEADVLLQSHLERLHDQSVSEEQPQPQTCNADPAILYEIPSPMEEQQLGVTSVGFVEAGTSSLGTRGHRNSRICLLASDFHLFMCAPPLLWNIP